MQPEDNGSQGPKLASQTVTKLYFVKAKRSYDLDVGSCPTL